MRLDVIAGRFALCDPIAGDSTGTVWRAWDLNNVDSARPRCRGSAAAERAGAGTAVADPAAGVADPAATAATAHGGPGR